MATTYFHPSILREYDIRGVVDETLFEEDAYWIGRCFGWKVKEASGNAVAVGWDGRLSSPALSEALMRGLCEAGLDVYKLGVGPTPMLYFAEYTLPVDAAIMVTGSHNPPDHNGFKMSLGRAPFFGKDIQSFVPLQKELLTIHKGTVHPRDLREIYAERLVQGLTFGKPLTIAWDPGNGATCEILKLLLQQLPGRHIVLNGEIDGHFPAHPPDPSEPQNLVQLQAAVIENKCDLGIAFDGDGDRLVAVDGEGHILWGDQLLTLFAADLLARKPQAEIIADIKVSQIFFNEVNRMGGTPIMWKTGHSHIKAKMAASGVILAGEMSGHFFFKENYYGFDDGMYAAMRLLHLLSHSSLTLAELYAQLPCYASTPEIRVVCDPARKFIVPQEIGSRLLKEGIPFFDIDGVRVQLETGWWLVRASNTQDLLIVRCEAYKEEDLDQVIAHMERELLASGVQLSS